LLIVFISCSTPPSGQEVVDRAIKASGVKKLKNAEASFKFREITYLYQYRNGQYRYTRIQKDSVRNEVKDVLLNSGLNRFVNDSLINIEAKQKTAYSASVNSVIYFAFLPLWLNDAAAIKEYVNEVTMKGQSYHKVKVTFDSEGGGEDHEDVFYYWFDTEDSSMDYLAYSYNEEDGKGVRFREAYNVRNVNGVIIQDYRNYKPKEENNFELNTIDQAFLDNELELLSVIELENVKVSL